MQRNWFLREGSATASLIHERLRRLRSSKVGSGVSSGGSGRPASCGLWGVVKRIVRSSVFGFDELVQTSVIDGRQAIERQRRIIEWKKSGWVRGRVGGEALDMATTARALISMIITSRSATLELPFGLTHLVKGSRHRDTL